MFEGLRFGAFQDHDQRRPLICDRRVEKLSQLRRWRGNLENPERASKSSCLAESDGEYKPGVRSVKRYDLWCDYGRPFSITLTFASRMLGVPVMA